jgi:hypothetical protein
MAIVKNHIGWDVKPAIRRAEFNNKCLPSPL